MVYFLINNQEDIYSYYISLAEGASDEAKEKFRRFDSRIKLTIFTSISINGLELSEKEIETHIQMLKLSESWFAFEALIPAIENYGYKSEKPQKKPKVKKVSSIQAALVIPKNFCDSKIPFGKPDFFDASRITDSYLEYLLENEMTSFKEYLNYILKLKKDDRTSLQDYIIYLENKSLGSQKDFLLESYNRLSIDSDIIPLNIMSVAYAVRNQYVHDGEIIDSGLEDIQIKCELLRGCYNYVVSYSLIIA